MALADAIKRAQAAKDMKAQDDCFGEILIEVAILVERLAVAIERIADAEETHLQHLRSE